MEGDGHNHSLGAFGCIWMFVRAVTRKVHVLGGYPHSNLNPNQKGHGPNSNDGWSQLFLQNAHKYSNMKARMGGPPIPRAGDGHQAATLKTSVTGPLDDVGRRQIVPTLAL